MVSGAIRVLVRSGLVASVVALVAAAACTSSDRTGSVTITVRASSSHPSPGSSVVFHRPDGSVDEVVLASADGTASARISAGSLVTVTPNDGSRWRFTIAGLEPGEDLVLARPDGPRLSGTATAALPGAVAGASSYTVDAGCTGAASETAAPALLLPLVQPACGAAFDALATASSGGATLAYATALAVPVEGSPPSEAAAASFGAWRTDLGTLDVDVANAPTDGASVYAILTPRRNGRPFALSGSSALAMLPATDGAFPLRFSFPPAFFDSAHVLVRVEFPSGVDLDSAGTALYAEAQAPLTSRALDLARVLPPRVYGAAASLENGALRVSWQRSGADPALDAVIVTASWLRDDGEERWYVVAPPGTTSFTFPALPSEVTELGPDGGTQPDSITVTTYDVEGTAGYAEFRAAHLDFVYRLPENEGFTLRAASTFTVR